MQKKILILILVACVISVCYAEGKKKTPKPVRQLNSLCLALEADQVKLWEPVYDGMFSELDGFCVGLLEAMNGTGKVPSKQLDGVVIMKKACGWYNKKYDPRKVTVPLDGLDSVCESYNDSKAASLGDKTSRKTMAKLSTLCIKTQSGKLAEYSSDYADVFDDLGDFCDDMLNDTSMASEKAHEVDGVEVLGEVCDWYNAKFVKIPAYGVMADLQPICTDFVEIRDGGGDSEDFEMLKEEEEFWMLVDFCQAMSKDRVRVSNENYTDVFEDLKEFCSGFLEKVRDLSENEQRMRKPKPAKMLDRICGWLDDMFEMNGTIDMLEDLVPICEDFYDVYEDDDDDDDEFDLMKEDEFRKLIVLCKAEQNGVIEVNEANYTDVIEDLGEFCDDFLEELEDMMDGESKKRDKEDMWTDVLDEICEWLDDVFEEEGEIDLLADLEPVCRDFYEIYDGDDDDDESDEFELFKEDEFRKLVFLCKSEQEGKIEVNEANYTDVFEDLGDFCDDFLEEVEDMMEGESKKRDKEDMWTDVLDEICEWLDDVFEEEGEIDLLADLEPVCRDFYEIYDGDDDDDESDEFELFKEDEFRKLVFLCKSEQRGEIEMNEANYTDVFEDLGDFCDDFLEEVEDMMEGESKKRDKEDMWTDVLDEICEWLDDVFEEEGEIDLLADLEPVCRDFYEIYDGDDDDDDDESDEFELFKEDEFRKLVFLCKNEKEGEIEVNEANYTDVFEDLGDFCDDFLEEVEDMMEGESKKRDKEDMWTDVLDEICEWLDDVFEEEGEIDLLADLEPVCRDFYEIYDGNDDDDESDEFELLKEDEFRKLVFLCKSEHEGKIEVNEANYTDVFEDLGEFCDDFLEEVEDMMEGENKKREKEVDWMEILEEVCEWLEYVFEEEGEIDLLADLEPVCNDFQEVLDM